jgi:ABC-type phosphate transport system substrate-binding protein
MSNADRFASRKMSMKRPMSYPKSLILTAGIVLLAALTVHAAGLKIIANSSVPATSISADDLRSIFLEEKSSLKDGTHVEPVLQKGGAAHEAFLKQYLDKNDSALQTYYRSLVFTGKGSVPKAVGSDAEVTAYVARTKGAIGYVSADAAAEGVKTLEVK